jgi:hypothetical protein
MVARFQQIYCVQQTYRGFIAAPFGGILGTALAKIEVCWAQKPKSGKRLKGNLQRHQSSSASRLTAGACGFLTFTQWGDVIPR